MIKIRVRIIGAKLAGYWYANKIGEVFEVEQSERNKEDYSVSVILEYQGILKTDCEIIEETMGKKDKLKKALDDVARLLMDDKNATHKDIVEWFLSLSCDEELFNKEPKIMNADDYMDKVLETPGIWNDVDIRKGFIAGCEETHKRYAKLKLKLEEIKKNDTYNEWAGDLVDLIITD